MEYIQIVGLIAGICTSASLIPQLITTLKTKKAEDVSVMMFIVMLTGNALWLYYGFVKAEFPIIATNMLSLGLNIVLVILKYKYKETTSAENEHKDK